MKSYVIVVFSLFSLNLFANPTDLNKYKNSDDQYNFYVEIPAGQSKNGK